MKSITARLLINLLITGFVIVITLTGADYNSNIGFINKIEKLSYDWRMQYFASADRRKNNDIVIVDIDDSSLRVIGAWPWQRNRIAEILDQLFVKYDARLVALGIPFSDLDRTAGDLLDEVKQQFNDDALAQNRIIEFESMFDYDGLLVDAMSNRRVILGYRFNNSGQRQGGIGEASDVTMQDNSLQNQAIFGAQSLRWHFYRGFVGNHASFIGAALDSGNLFLPGDSDGVIRRAPMMARYSTGIYPGLPLALLRYRQSIGGDPVKAIVADGNVTGVQTGNREIPVGYYGDVFINYRGIGGRSANFDTDPNATFAYYSATDILRGQVNERLLKDKIVLIGSSSNALRDTFATPGEQKHAERRNTGNGAVEYDEQKYPLSPA